MLWSKVIGSLKRHLFAIMAGEDYDYYPDTCANCKEGNCVIHTGELHIDNLQCNAHFLSTYYRIYPQGDDRFMKTRVRAKIGLDIDDVICSWVKEWSEKWGIPLPTAWNFDWNLQEKFENMRLDKTLNDFYLNLPLKERPEDIPFVPHCYITHRPVPQVVSEMWLETNGFPLKPVFQVNSREEKIKVAREQGLDIFVDDNYDTFVAMNQAGICCFLYDALHNRRHNVGYRRIKSLKEILA